MTGTLSVTTKAKKLPVSVADVKRHLGVSTNARDIDIENLIIASSNELIRRTGRALTQTTLAYSFPSWPECEIELPYPPLGSITSVDYFDTDGAAQVLASTEYQLISPYGLPVRILPEPGVTWPSLESDRENAVTINYTAGTDTLSEIPEEAKLYIRMRVRYWYDRPDGTPGNLPVDSMTDAGMNSLIRSLWSGTYVAAQIY